MIETSSVPPRKSSASFSNLRQSSENVQKMFGDVLQVFGTILENLRKSSESGRKSSESRHKRRLYNKQNNTWRLEIWNLSSRVHIRYLTRSLRSLVRYRCEHSKINSISPRADLLFSMSSLTKLGMKLKHNGK